MPKYTFKTNVFLLGFGDLKSEFWLGNDVISNMTDTGFYTLRVDVQASNMEPGYAVFHVFKIFPESEKYKLLLGMT